MINYQFEGIGKDTFKRILIKGFLNLIIAQYLMNSPPSFPPLYIFPHELPPSFSSLYLVKRGKSLKSRVLPPLCGAERGLGVSSWGLTKRDVKYHRET
jgi:hypothetical protein